MSLNILYNIWNQNVHWLKTSVTYNHPQMSHKLLTNWQAYLEAVCQVAWSVGEIRFQFQSRAVRRDSLWDITSVLVYWRQVTVCVSERWVDLYSTSVALHCRLHVLLTYHINKWYDEWWSGQVSTGMGDQLPGSILGAGHLSPYVTSHAG